LTQLILSVVFYGKNFTESSCIFRLINANNYNRKNCEVLAMAYNKVVISGINTSKLTVLKEKEKMDLLREIQETGSKEAKDKLINGNLRLVLSVIQKFTNRGEDIDDLFQIGVVGLIKAINNFDLTKEVRFSTYCVPMIAGELRRYLRDYSQIKVSRSMKDLAYKAMQAKERLTAANQREPKIEEIAKEIGAERSDVVLALESISDPVSLYEPVYSDSGDTLYVLDQIGDKNDVDSWLDEISLKEAIRDLHPREKNILYLRFFQGKTQVEVANEIGISQAQVSRLEKGALAKVKGQI
jgi:RNA polymerase sporulation-specific sigma factor